MRPSKVLLMSVALLVIQVACSAQSWEPAPPFPMPVMESGVAEMNGKLYVVGGKLAGGHWGQLYYNTTYVLDPATGTWTQLASFPQPRARIATAVVNGKLYAIGGYTQNGNYAVQYTDVDIYDPASDTWSKGPDLPFPVCAAGAVALGTEVWLIGIGQPFIDPTPLILDLATSTWRSGPAQPYATASGGVAQADGRIWLVSGWDPSAYQYTGSVLAWEPVSGWTISPTELPVPRGEFGCASDGRYIYVVGGGWYPAWLNRTDILDTVTGEWMQGPNLPEGRQYNRSAVVAGYLYCVGGESGFYGTDNHVWRLALPDTVPPTIADVVADKSVLWPPNHKMADVYLDYLVTDDRDPAPAVVVALTSSEPENGLGDGDTGPDWEIVGPHHIRLRAERAGNGSGRIYTITITATDASGNVATATTAVTVPKNMRK